VISGCHAGVYGYMPEVRHILGTLQGGATLHAPVIYWLARMTESEKVATKEEPVERGTGTRNNEKEHRKTVTNRTIGGNRCFL
jgi:hypothetical protein